MNTKEFLTGILTTLLGELPQETKELIKKFPETAIEDSGLISYYDNLVSKDLSIFITNTKDAEKKKTTAEYYDGLEANLKTLLKNHGVNDIEDVIKEKGVKKVDKTIEKILLKIKESQKNSPEKDTTVLEKQLIDVMKEKEDLQASIASQYVPKKDYESLETTIKKEKEINQFVTKLRASGLVNPDILNDSIISNAIHEKVKQKLNNGTIDYATNIVKNEHGGIVSHNGKQLTFEGVIEQVVSENNFLKPQQRQQSTPFVPNTPQNNSNVPAAFTQKIAMLG